MAKSDKLVSGIYRRPRGPFSPPFLGPTVMGSFTAEAPFAPHAAMPANPAAGKLCVRFFAHNHIETNAIV